MIKSSYKKMKLSKVKKKTMIMMMTIQNGKFKRKGN